MSGDLSGVPGAVVSDGILQHLGSPLAEQRALAAGAALVPERSRSVIAVSGPDRLTWLDSITSQAVAGLTPGDSAELLVLDPHGHVEHAAAITDDGETAWLIVDATRRDALLTFLTRMRFRLRVEPTDASESHRVIAGTSGAVAGLDYAAVWHDPWPGVTEGGWGYARLGTEESHPGADRDWAEAIVPVAEEERLIVDAAAGQAVLAGELAAEALRVAAWRPRAEHEADGKTLPHEVDWLRSAVHLEKGCYRGQETVAKVHNLGHPPRRLALLQLDGSDAVLPEAGALVLRDGEEVGVVTSVARHHEEGPIALALLKRTVPVDAPLAVAVDADTTVAAAQEEIVPPDAGRTASIPRLPRLSRRR